MSPATWNRLCPLGEWRDPVVEAVEAHLARPAVREALRRHERNRRYPGDVIAALRERGLPEIFTEAPRITAYNLCDLNAVTARAGGSLAISVAIPGLALLPLYIAGREDQRRRAFSLLRQGEMAALLLTEWGHGSDLARMETRAEAVDDGFSLVGEKHLINGGTVARLLVTLARTGDRAGGDGPFSRSSDLSVLLVERDDTVEALPAMPTLPVPGADISGVRFHGTPVGAEAVIGEVGEGFSIIQRTLILSRGGIASLAAGTATAAWDVCWSYARERRIYGASILELGAIRDHLLRVAALDALSSALAARCAAAMNAQGQAAAYVTATAKFACCALAEEAVTEGRRIMGARAFLEDQPYARLVRDVPLYGVFDGTSHIMLGQIRDHLGQMIRQSDVGPEEVLERTRALYGATPRSFLAMGHRRHRARVLPLDVRARALVGLPGAVDLAPLARIAGAMVELVPELQAGGRWTRDQGAGFALAAAAARLEALLALAELGDGRRREALGMPASAAPLPLGDEQLRYALALGGIDCVVRVRGLARRAGSEELVADLDGAEEAWISELEATREALHRRIRVPELDGIHG